MEEKIYNFNKVKDIKINISTLTSLELQKLKTVLFALRKGFKFQVATLDDDISLMRRIAELANNFLETRIRKSDTHSVTIDILNENPMACRLLGRELT